MNQKVIEFSIECLCSPKIPAWNYSHTQCQQGSFSKPILEFLNISTSQYLYYVFILD